ncbi:MAE_28990/MAE_18760 family HEPN-like nuclease [Longimicrobium sp.]|uniref:MAE_28990/MAE_18760 family HEPN-like nuclease n=1 Tax=Longimicrobium sp. TaxID=2029185 RepID=UPI002ED8F44F
MNSADFRAQLEGDLAWRLDELRLLRNQLSNIPVESDRLRYRKAIILVLYSHFEGFCKTAFGTYANAVNEQKIRCEDASPFLVAASLDRVFKALSDPNKKADIFRRAAPDDAPLHRFARQVEFIEGIADVNSTTVSLNVDEVIDMESNLKPIVLRKILFRLGLAHDQFAADEGAISRLLGTRNNIAHGAERGGIDQDELDALEALTLRVQTRIMIGLTDALSHRKYLKAAA